MSPLSEQNVGEPRICQKTASLVFFLKWLNGNYQHLFEKYPVSTYQQIHDDLEV